MLADERADSLVTNFAAQWLHLRNLDGVTPDLRLFPDFDDNLRRAFRRETELFVGTINNLRYRQIAIFTIKIRVCGWANTCVVRTHLLAYITAKDAISHRLSNAFGRQTFSFYRPIGDAPTCIHVVLGCDSLRGAGVHTARATATMVRDDGVGRNFYVDE